MALYFFDTHDGYRLSTDEEGQDLDPSKVRHEALSALADMAHDNLPKDNLGCMFVSVRDASGLVLFRATVSLTIEEDRTRLDRSLYSSAQFITEPQSVLR